MTFFEQFIRAVVPMKSTWRLGTSGGVEVSVGTPIARVYVAATGGTLYMGIGDQNNYIPYNYVGAGGGLGFGLEIPVSASVSLPSLPATGGEFGRLYVTPRRLRDSIVPQYQSIDVDKDTISGPATLIAPSLSLFGAAGGFSIILFGFTGVPSFTNPFAMLDGCNAVAFQAGISVITPGAGLNCSYHQLQIMKAGKMQKWPK